MNGHSDENYREDIETLLGGGLEAAAADALEARLRASESAWEAYAELKALAGELDGIGEALAARTPEIDLVEDVMLCVDLEAAGEASAAGVPEVDLTEDVMLRADLVALGERFAGSAPRVDIEDAVMAAVAAERAKGNVVKLRPRAARPGRGRRPVLSASLALAAAACLLFASWLGARWLLPPDTATEGPVVARSTDPAVAGGPSASSGTPAADGSIAPVRPGPISPPSAAIDAPDAPDEEAPPSNSYDDITLESILLARANAINGTEADRALLARLAGLSPEEARRLVEQAGLSIEAVLGAVLFLPPEEAVNLLLAKLSQAPNDPYLRYALAKSLSGIEGGADEARRQLAEWRRTDPNNAMPYLMEAELALREADIQAALLAFEQSAGFGQAYGYVSQTASQRAQALMAAGYGANEARLLAAATAGADEYLQMRDLATKLLDAGRYYESIGDYATAETIYGAVRQFGEDVVAGGNYINEHLAGLEIQHEALGSLQGLYNVLGDPETINALMQSFALLAQAFTDLRSYIETYNAILASGDLDLINNIVGLVLQQGDMNMLGQPSQP